MRRSTYILIFTCLASAVAVTWVRHENREEFIQLQAVYDKRDNLNIEWQRLLIEKTASSRYDKLEVWAQSNETLNKPEEQHVLLLRKQSVKTDYQELTQ